MVYCTGVPSEQGERGTELRYRKMIDLGAVWGPFGVLCTAGVIEFFFFFSSFFTLCQYV